MEEEAQNGVTGLLFGILWAMILDEGVDAGDSEMSSQRRKIWYWGSRVGQTSDPTLDRGIPPTYEVVILSNSTRRLQKSARLNSSASCSCCNFHIC